MAILIFDSILDNIPSSLEHELSDINVASSSKISMNGRAWSYGQNVSFLKNLVRKSN